MNVYSYWGRLREGVSTYAFSLQAGFDEAATPAEEEKFLEEAVSLTITEIHSFVVLSMYLLFTLTIVSITLSFTHLPISLLVPSLLCNRILSLLSCTCCGDSWHHEAQTRIGEFITSQYVAV